MIFSSKFIYSKLFISVDGIDVFTGFPYLMTELDKGFFNLMLLPAHWNLREIFNFVDLQTKKNRLPNYVVLGVNKFIYFPPYGHRQIIRQPPQCTAIVFDFLFPVYPLEEDDELKWRKELLEEASLRKNLIKNDIIMEFLLKGGKAATYDEYVKLQNFQEKYYAHGKIILEIPAGLKRCSKCGLFRGKCLDPFPQFTGMIVKVSCLCQNDNFCAGCGKPLFALKLNSNFFDVNHKIVRHVSGLYALDHVCNEERSDEENNGDI